MSNQALSKKLAEWAGFRLANKDEVSEGCTVGLWWRWPTAHIKTDLPEFTNSLDACFKWLVPKLMQWKPVDLAVGQLALSPKYWCELTNHKLSTKAQDGIIDIWKNAETPTLALCLAIEKLIDKEKK